MTIDTWVSLATLIVALGTFCGFMSRRSTKAEERLRAEIAGLRGEVRSDSAGLRTELRSEIAGLRTELRSDIADVRADLKHLDDRVYALAAGLRPQLETPEREQA